MPTLSAPVRIAAVSVALAISSSCVLTKNYPTDLRGLSEAQRDAPAAHPVVGVRARLVDETTVDGRLLTVTKSGFTVRLTSGQVQTVYIDQVRSLKAVVYSPGASTAATMAVVTLAIPATLALLALLLIAASSCPVVAVEGVDGEWQVVGEAFAGAIAPSAERADLLRLPRLDPGARVVRLSRQPGEIDHLDAVHLVLVAPRAGAEIVGSLDGEPVAVSAPIAPLRATDLEGADVTALVADDDARAWTTQFVELLDDPDPPLREGVVGAFPAGAGDTLLVDAAATPAQDLALRAAWDALGDRQAATARRLAPPSARDRVLTWRDAAGIDLRVEVRDGDRWVRVAAIPTPGWMAGRRVAVPLPPAEGPREVRVSGGVGQWTVDQLAIVHRGDAPEVRVLAPTDAALAASDDARLDLDATNPEVRVAFDVPAGDFVPFLRVEGHYDVLPSDAPGDVALARELRGHPERFGLLGLREARLALAP